MSVKSSVHSPAPKNAPSKCLKSFLVDTQLKFPATQIQISLLVQPHVGPLWHVSISAQVLVVLVILVVYTASAHSLVVAHWFVATSAISPVVLTVHHA